MKKTLTANISGTVFHIEEDAYETLQRYLANIRGQFAGTQGREDIMADIEARIAELFTERLDGRRQVVSQSDVDHVVAIMGQPEDFADGEPGASGEAGAPPPEPTSGQQRSQKRFFRDDEDKWLGGVLGGLGAYIGVDPLWLRIAMIVLVWASVGVLIPIYILLWILVPITTSAADRLQMRGEPVTVENIKRVVEEGAEKLKQGGERLANEASTLGRDWQSGAKDRKSRAAEVVLKLIGIGLIVTAFSLLLGLITGIIGGTVSLWHATWTSEDAGILDLGELLFTSRTHALWFGIGAFTLLVVPIIGLFLSGFRLLLDTRAPKWLGISLVAVWCAAFIPTLWGAMDIGRDFKRSNSVRTEIVLAQPAEGLLYLDSMNPADSAGDWSVRFDDGELDVDLDGLHLENGMVFGAWADLDIERSADTLYHLKVKREAHGSSAKAALGRAEAINYGFKQEGDVLFVSPVLRYAMAEKFRGQDVQFTLEVPLGKSVFLRPGSKDVIYDIDNVTNTLDKDMLGRTWTMTEEGLVDPSTPRKRNEEEGIPKDTIRTNDIVAASVWRGPVKHKAKTPARRTNERDRTSTPAPMRQASLVPNIFGLLVNRLH